jgi:hypothetical protein
MVTKFLGKGLGGPLAGSEMNWRGAWTNSQYELGDVVSNSGRLYVCNTEVIPGAAASYVGSSTVTSNSNALAALTLPTGSLAGDLLIVSIGFFSNATTGAQTTPTGMTQILNSSTAASAGVVGLYQYLLTAGDIATGSVTMPVQANCLATFGYLATAQGFRNATASAVTSATTTLTTATLTPASTGFVVSGVISNANSPGTLANASMSGVAGGFASVGVTTGTAYEATVATISTTTRTFAVTIGTGSAKTISVAIYPVPSGVFPATSFSELAVDPAAPLNYKGAWSSTTAYALNDVVISGNKSFVCTTAQPALTASFVGAATKNTLTSTGNITLPAGSAVGDLALMAVAAESAPTVNTGFTNIGTETGPSSTITQLNYRLLTQADITAGFITTTFTTADGAIVLYVMRNVTAAPSIQSGSATTATVATFTPAATGLAVVFFRGLAAITTASASGGFGNVSLVAGTNNNDALVVASAASTAAVATSSSTVTTSPTLNASFLSCGGMAFPFGASISSTYFTELGAAHDSNGRLQAADPSAALDLVNLEYLQANAIQPVVKSVNFAGTAAAVPNTIYYYTVSGSMTLPAAAGNTSIYIIKNQSTTASSINTTGGNTIEGMAAPFVLNNYGAGVMIINDGSGVWRIFGVMFNNSTVLTKSGPYTVTLADLLAANTIDVTGTTTITLPDATSSIGAEGHRLTIKNMDATLTTTIATTSAQTIDGTTTKTLTTQYAAITVQSNGTNWVIVAKV